MPTSGKNFTIVGPTFQDLAEIGFDGDFLCVATAFYSRGGLKILEQAKAKTIRIACRLDLSSIEEWKRGYINPGALYDLLLNKQSSGCSIEIYISPTAHAKIYVGDRGALIGSANLTVSGFAGGEEVVRRIGDTRELENVAVSFMKYAQLLQRISLEDLSEYVRRNKGKIGGVKYFFDKLSYFSRDKNPRLGCYSNFLLFLCTINSDAARLILDRAKGKQNLQGHIRSNFYGIRQFLLINGGRQKRFEAEAPDSYKLFEDEGAVKDFNHFVNHYAVEEDNFSLNTWKTYLPMECGGRATRRGGTIGNLNRMIPLVARYLAYQKEQNDKSVSRKARQSRVR